jgi:H/ACA ribonucleoprotein complex subunit 4
MKKIVILSFDIPRSKAGFRVKVWRELQDLGASLQMRSFWVLPFNKSNLREFKKVCEEIIMNGGKASVVVGDVIHITRPNRNVIHITKLTEKSIIVLDKPSGPTSREVIEEVKRILECKKAGHTGILDPRASGVLVIALNKAVKLMPVLMGLDKEYEGVMYLHKDVDLKSLEEVISKHFVGDIIQVPPVKSRVARRPRKRRVYHFKILKKKGKNVEFRTKVQAGTYIRKLISDIGEKLGVGAHMKELRRTKVGHFRIEDSHSLEEIKKARDSWMEGDETFLEKILVPIEKAIPHVKRICVKDSSVETIRNGAPVRASDTERIQDGIKPGETVGIFSSRELIALGIARVSSERMRKMKGSIVRTDRVF